MGFNVRIYKGMHYYVVAGGGLLIILLGIINSHVSFCVVVSSPACPFQYWVGKKHPSAFTFYWPHSVCFIPTQEPVIKSTVAGNRAICGSVMTALHPTVPETYAAWRMFTPSSLLHTSTIACHV